MKATCDCLKINKHTNKKVWHTSSNYLSVWLLVAQNTVAGGDFCPQSKMVRYHENFLATEFPWSCIGTHPKKVGVEN